MYTEVVFKRKETPNEDGTVKVTFHRTEKPPVKKKLTDQEAEILNKGKLSNPGNIEFTYLIKEGEKDPAPITLKTTVAADPIRNK